MDISEYILDHIEPEGEYLYRLYRATNIHTIHGRMASGHLQGRLLKMLVRMAQIDGKTCYYPITLPPLKPNHIYTINNLTLTRPGTDSPDMTDPLSSMSFNLQVQPWSNETVSDVTI